MPGHCRAALAAYPQLGCTGGPYSVSTTAGIKKDIYCAGKEEVFSFLQGVLDEVIALFPSPWIHIGGDEAPKNRWRPAPAVRSGLPLRACAMKKNCRLTLSTVWCAILRKRAAVLSAGTRSYQKISLHR